VVAARPPFAASAAALPAAMSKPLTWCPALTRLAAIGAPILPRPMKPMVAISGSSCLIVWGEAELAIGNRSEKDVDHAVADFGEGCRLPVRFLFFVDEHRAPPFVEVLGGHHMLRQPIFEGECGFEIIFPADDQLAQCDLETGRRFCQQARLCLRRPIGM